MPYDECVSFGARKTERRGGNCDYVYNVTVWWHFSFAHRSRHRWFSKWGIKMNQFGTLEWLIGEIFLFSLPNGGIDWVRHVKSSWFFVFPVSIFSLAKYIVTNWGKLKQNSIDFWFFFSVYSFSLTWILLREARLIRNFARVE